MERERGRNGERERKRGRERKYVAVLFQKVEISRTKNVNLKFPTQNKTMGCFAVDGENIKYM